MLNKTTYRELKQRVIIDESNQKLKEIPQSFLRFTPHPYQKLGAPYGDKSPFFLRSKVIELLLLAQNRLTQLKPDYRLKIFDAYRPIEVQKFMIESDTQRISQELYKTSFEKLLDAEKIEVQNIIKHFWSPISENISLNPPPHSTGAALDLTIVNENGVELDMGTQIDELVEAAASDYYQGSGSLYEKNRNLLFDVMSGVGFSGLPTEWWHFSYGDQIWVVDKTQKEGVLLEAIYGLI